MKMFVGIVHHDPGSAWGVSFPDAPGCFAAADAMEDVVAAGAEALALWFEDQPEAAPTPIEAVDPQGGALVLIPWIRPAADTVRANLSLPRHVLRAIDEAARARKLTRSAFITAAALNEIEGRR